MDLQCRFFLVFETSLERTKNACLLVIRVWSWAGKQSECSNIDTAKEVLNVVSKFQSINIKELMKYIGIHFPYQIFLEFRRRLFTSYRELK